MHSNHAGHTHAVYFIAEIVLKLTAVARFKLHRGLTVTCSEIGNKNIPPTVSSYRKMRHIFNIYFLLFATVSFGQRYEDLVNYELQIDIAPSFIEGVDILLKHYDDSLSSISIKNYYINDERMIETVKFHKLTTFLDDYEYSHTNSTITDTVFKNGDTLILSSIGLDGVTVSGSLKRNNELNSFSFWSPSRSSQNGKLMFLVFELLDSSFKEERIEKYLTELKGCFNGYPSTLDSYGHKEFMIRNEVYMIVEKMPQFKGGADSLVSYIQRSIKKSEVINQTNIKGKVYVNFVIDEKGKVLEPEILRSLATEIDNECLRIIEQMPDWIPGEHYGNRVKVSYRIPIIIDE